MNRPIFIFGCPRSGTSLLSRIVGNHPRIAIPFESQVYPALFNWAKYYGDLSVPQNRERLVSDILSLEYLRMWEPKPSVHETLSAIQRYDFHGVFEGLMRAWARSQGKHRWGEKTPQNTFYWRELLKGFPNMQVLNIVRDGRDVALSYKKAVFGPKHVYLIAQRWVEYLRVGEEVRAVLGKDSFLEVRYEDLLSNPTGAVQEICSFLGEEYVTEMLESYKSKSSYPTDPHNELNLHKPILKDNAGKWREQMKKRDLNIFEAVSGTYLERYGYKREVLDASISPLEVFSYRYLERPLIKIPSLFKNYKSQKVFLQRLRIYLRLRLGI